VLNDSGQYLLGHTTEALRRQHDSATASSPPSRHRHPPPRARYPNSRLRLDCWQPAPRAIARRRRCRSPRRRSAHVGSEHHHERHLAAADDTFGFAATQLKVAGVKATAADLQFAPLLALSVPSLVFRV